MTARTLSATTGQGLLLPRRRKIGGVIMDNFNRSNGSVGNAETGQTWTNRAQSFTIASNKIVPAVNGVANVMTIDAGVSDVESTAWISRGSSGSCAPAVRWNSGSQVIFMRYLSSAVQIYESATFGLIAQASYSLTAGVTAKFTLRAVGPSIIGLVDDVIVCSGQSSLWLTSTHHGLWGEDTTTNSNVDAYSLTPLSPSGGLL